MIVPRRQFVLLSVAIAVSFTIAGCACKPWTGPRTTASASGQIVCALHHVPLVTTRAYRARDDTCVLMADWYETARCYPNHIPAKTSLRSGGDVFTIPVTIHYCPLCEGEVQKEDR